MNTLGRESIAMALAEANQGQEHYHMLDCSRCRRAIKVQVTELRRHLPADYALPDVPPPVAPKKEEPAS
jgi:hypothetical protein